MVATLLLLVDPRSVGGMGDVHRDRQVWLKRERGRQGALGADLLLGSGDRRHPALEAAALVHPAGRLERHIDAEPVVETAGGELAPFERERVGRDYGRVSDPDALERLVAVGGADVDVHVAELRDLLALLVAQQMY